MIVLGFRPTSLHDECLQLYYQDPILVANSVQRIAARFHATAMRPFCSWSHSVFHAGRHHKLPARHEQRPLHARQRNKVTALGHSRMLKPQHEACHHAGVAAGPGPGTGIPAAAAGGRSAGGAAARAAVAHRLYSGHPVDCRLLRARHQPPLHILTHHPRMRQLEPALSKHREPTYKRVPPLAGSTSEFKRSLIANLVARRSDASIENIARPMDASNPVQQQRNTVGAANETNVNGWQLR